LGQEVVVNGADQPCHQCREEHQDRLIRQHLRCTCLDVDVRQDDPGLRHKYKYSWTTPDTQYIRKRPTMPTTRFISCCWSINVIAQL
jgi:hypothetical protein